MTLWWVRLVYAAALAMGSFILAVGALLLYIGIKTPEGQKVSWGLGTYYDRTGICIRAVLVLFLGSLVLTAGFLV
jgi:hypothetical protein